MKNPSLNRRFSVCVCGQRKTGVLRSLYREKRRLSIIFREAAYGAFGFLHGQVVRRVQIPRRACGGNGHGVPHLCARRKARRADRLVHGVAGAADGAHGRRQFLDLPRGGGRAGTMYKYRIYTTETDFIDHCDPYGFGMELRPNTASIVRRLDGYTFGDGGGCARGPTAKRGRSTSMRCTSARSKSRAPRRTAGTRTGDRGTARAVCERAGLQLHRDHAARRIPERRIVGLPGHRLFQPDRALRHAGRAQIPRRRLPPERHRRPARLCARALRGGRYALARYDGTALYEYPHADVGSSEWGSCNFMHSRGEVRSFLQSAANYWLEEFHIDGLRMDAISRRSTGRATGPRRERRGGRVPARG